MLYLVGGASRAGKTMVARRIMRERRIPYLSLDWLMMGFTDGVPEYGIHDKLFPDDIARRLWPFLQAMAGAMLWTGDEHVIEGEALLPSLVRELMDEHPGKVRACFLGYVDLAVEDGLRRIRGHGGDATDWLAEESDAYVRDHVGNMIAHSRLVRDDCDAVGLRYFDVSDDFPAAITEAERYLLAG